MEDLIRRCLGWVRTLLAPPGNGRHRARPSFPSAGEAIRSVPRPVGVPPMPLVTSRTRRRAGVRVRVTTRAVPLPTSRRWWRADEPADGDRSPLVRPYLIAYEQYERRRALALALDGIDVGPSVIHGVRVGAAW